jgi:uncharacterized damage-inducible protein DinB
VSIKDSLLPEYDHEMGTARKLIERVPDGEMGWKPHQRSMSIGELAMHIAEIPGWAGAILKAPEFDMSQAGEEHAPKAPASRADLLQKFDKTVADARALIADTSDAEFMGRWALKNHGQDVFSAPRIVATRSFIFNHAIHHRGQLSVYLRLKNIPVPAIYGPSADEGGM